MAIPGAETLRRIRSWDWLSKAALLLCFGDAILVIAVIWYPETAYMEPTDWLLNLFMLPLLVPLVGAPQVAMLILIRWSRSAVLRWLCLVASAGMIALYHPLAVAVGLSSSSTAGVALIIQPLLWGAISFGTGGALEWLRRLMAGQLE